MAQRNADLGFRKALYDDFYQEEVWLKQMASPVVLGGLPVLWFLPGAAMLMRQRAWLGNIYDESMRRWFVIVASHSAHESLGLRLAGYLYPTRRP